ncbi:hypothetical protein [Streptomyces sp. t39]|uniref:hypothetical protein n=1 Tax=Streptomyces sp. t39 TaxID=1828156 RepID=UPI00164FE1D8|nr:hypothetical protein [Streptomyces sp. t39]
MTESPDRTPLPRSFFDRPVPGAAPRLPGCTRVRRTEDRPIAPRRTEAGAYAGEAASGA